jgi:predicted GH43/DUF377 family glycosyl hydrolase
MQTIRSMRVVQRRFLFQALLASLSLVILFFQACGTPLQSSSSDNASGSSGSYLSSCFVANPNPIFKSGSFFNGSNWNDPSVIKVGTQYVMYASSGTGSGVQIYRLVSNDGANWSLSPSTAVFTNSPSATAWDRVSVETPAVVLFNNTYYLFYTGYTDQTNVGTYQVGYATSPDGITWTRSGTTSLLAPTDPTGAVNNDFNQFVVGEPGPVVFQNQLYLYFTAVGYDSSLKTTVQTIGLVTSPDGLTWSAPQKVLVPSQTLYPSSANWAGYSTPSAIVLNNQVHLFFDVVQESPWLQLKIHHAVSTDGMTAWVQDAHAIFDFSQFNWTTREIRSPTALLDGGTLFLWFAGDNGTTLGIGEATCPFQ